MERRALAIDPKLADAHSWLGTGLLSLGQVEDAIASIKEAIRLEPENGQSFQALGRALWSGKGDFASAIPAFRRAIELNPEAGYSYLQLGLLLAWEGQYEEAEAICRRAVELQDQYISGNAGLQVVGANARLGYVFYLQGRYEEAIREYERGLAFVASSDHALKERTSIEIAMKIGAAYHPLGQARRGGALLRPRAQGLRRPGGQGRGRSVHALLHRLPARAPRRGRARARHARTRLRGAPGFDGRSRQARSRSRQPARPAPVRGHYQRLNEAFVRPIRNWTLAIGNWSQSNSAAQPNNLR